MAAKASALMAALAMAVLPLSPASADPVILCTDAGPIEPPDLINNCVTISFGDDGSISVGTGGIDGVGKVGVTVGGENGTTVCHSTGSGEECLP